MNPPLIASARRYVIDRLMAARFHSAVSPQIRGGDPTYWASRHGVGRAIHSDALRERSRLRGASDAQLCAELAELT